MKKAVITGPRRAELAEVPEPKPVGNWAVVKVHVAPLCTEYKMFEGGHPADNLGHEAVGEVVAVDRSSLVKEGDRVVVMPLYPCLSCELCLLGDYIHCENGPDFHRVTGGGEGSATLTQYLLKPDLLLRPIPEGISYEKAGLACCALGPSFGAFDRMAVDAFDTVLITGLGPVGLGAVVNAVYRGARVFGVDSVSYRREKALLLGADRVFDPGEEGLVERIREATGGNGADRSLDCAGAPAAHRLCIDATRRRGQVAFVGECSDETTIRVSPDMIRKGLSLHGSWHYNLNLYPKIMLVIERSPGVDQLVSHVFPMSRIQEAFETSATHECAKILVKPFE